MPDARSAPGQRVYRYLNGVGPHRAGDPPIRLERRPGLFRLLWQAWRAWRTEKRRVTDF